MHPKQQYIHALRLNQLSKLKSFVQTTSFRFRATLGCSLIPKTLYCCSHELFL